MTFKHMLEELLEVSDSEASDVSDTLEEEVNQALTMTDALIA